MANRMHADGRGLSWATRSQIKISPML